MKPFRFGLPVLVCFAAPAVVAQVEAKPGAAQPAAAPSRYQLRDAFPAQAPFARPLHLDHHAADPDVFYVVEQFGRIFRIPRDGENKDRHLFLDWRSKTLSPAKESGGQNEEGLLGFAFDPDFAKNGYVYIYYTFRSGSQKIRRRPGRGIPIRESVVARLATRVKEGQRVADPASELPLLRVPQPYSNHNAGTIVFGPDRMLYIALGDGGYKDDPKKHGQNLGTLLGSILRIDVAGATAARPYRIPADNPFVGKEGARGEIWAYGLRNPWRINFDRKTGDLWCADVGQDLWEEVDIIVKGGNYGWNKMEGTHPFPPGAKPAVEGLIPPVAEYHHRDGISITGGQVYRGTAMPELQGCYLYADYVSGRLWSLRREGETYRSELLIRRAGAVASFAEGPDGEVFILRFDGNKISELVPAAAK